MALQAYFKLCLVLCWFQFQGKKETTPLIASRLQGLLTTFNIGILNLKESLVYTDTRYFELPKAIKNMKIPCLAKLSVNQCFLYVYVNPLSSWKRLLTESPCFL